MSRVRIPDGPPLFSYEYYLDKIEHSGRDGKPIDVRMVEIILDAKVIEGGRNALIAGDEEEEAGTEAGIR